MSEEIKNENGTALVGKIYLELDKAYDVILKLTENMNTLIGQVKDLIIRVNKLENKND